MMINNYSNDEDMMIPIETCKNNELYFIKKRKSIPDSSVYTKTKVIKVTRLNLYDEFLNEWSREWFQYILDNPNKRWNYNVLSSNSNITWDVIQANKLNIKWNDEGICRNPNIRSETE